MSSEVEGRRMKRIMDFRQTQDIPPTYKENSKVEEDLVNFAEQFRTQYHKFHPFRKPLFLTASNECGKKKMVCTYIRPTVMKYDELFDLEKCCRYIAHYMFYETTQDPQAYTDPDSDLSGTLPPVVVSPATALRWQVGNCFEISMIMCSLLLGAGYNSFVVVGYAKPSVCVNDQTEEVWEDDLPIEHNSDEDEEEAPELDPEYAALLKKKTVLRQVSDPDPQYNFDLGDQKDPLAGKTAKDVKPPSNRNRPVHCWVMVLPGGRKTVKEPVMIEPSTGKKIPMNAADHYYTGVESVFNHKMYYVNLQPDAVVSAISTDLLDATQWESVFPREKESEEVDPLSNTQQANLLGLTSRRALTTVETVNSETPDDNWKPGIFIPMSWVRELTLSPQQYESRYPGGSKEIQYSDATVRFYADYSQPDLRVKEVIVSDHLDRDSEQTHILFKHRADKLRRRLIIPQDRASERSPAAINIPSYRLMHEWYDKGRTKDASFEGLREFIYEPGKERTMKFYWRSREDGLRLRNDVFHDEQTLHRSREEYRERPDRLRQRSAVYDRPRTGREANIHQAIVLTGVEAGLKEIKEYPRLEPIQISQKYTRNPSIPVERDVYKIKFTMPPANTNTVGEMSVIFHYPENSLIRPSRLFVKASSSVEDYIASSVSKKIVEPPVKVVTMPGVPPPSELDLHKERKWLSGMEAVCISEVRKKLDEAFDILLRRDQDQAQVQQVLSSYDTLRNRPLESEAARAQKLAEAKRREESRRDYLAPYIARMNIPSWVNGNYLSVTLNSDQSRQVRDEALLELKERLIQRGRIMQSRMDKEKEEFARRQAAFQKNGETAAIDGSRDAEEFAIYCKEATWRMKVLDERLSKHITLASEKYAQLAQRLAEDPRLAALYGH